MIVHGTCNKYWLQAISLIVELKIKNQRVLISFANFRNQIQCTASLHCNAIKGLSILNCLRSSWQFSAPKYCVIINKIHSFPWNGIKKANYSNFSTNFMFSVDVFFYFNIIQTKLKHIKRAHMISPRFTTL